MEKKMKRSSNKETVLQNFLKAKNALLAKKADYRDFVEKRLQESLDMFEDILTQVPIVMTNSLLPKTPRPTKKKVNRIQAIPEEVSGSNSKLDDSIEELQPKQSKVRGSKKSSQILRVSKIDPEESDEVKDDVPVRRTTRTASKRANDNASNVISEEVPYSPKLKKIRLTKKQQEIAPDLVPDVPIKLERPSAARSLVLELEDVLLNAEPGSVPAETAKSSPRWTRKRTNQNADDDDVDSPASDSRRSDEPPLKKPNIEKSITGSDSKEPSLYEDAVFMSATMNNSTLLLHKQQLNPKVMIEPLIYKSASDETFVLEKKESKSGKSLRSLRSSKEKPAGNSLITDDETEEEKEEEEVKRKNPKKRVLRSSVMSTDDEIVATPPSQVQAANKFINVTGQAKNTFKSSSVLFSPYLSKSVKKRVEAFEQVVAASPQKESAAGSTRVTRNNARGRTKKEEESEDGEEADSKENKKKTLRPVNSLLSKYHTPVSKPRIPMPTSTSKGYNPVTPVNPSIYNSHSKPLTASRTNNLVGNVESFIPKSTSKITSSTDKSEEKRRKMSTDDAKLKRDIQLKAKTEEKKKKREMKERKIKETLLAKERLETEKRQKAEKEREEKARLALMAQEKAREEAERKRLAHQQRMQEKEEKRKQELLLRQQRAQEQEELERQLAEQRRLEQEHEKKMLAEARAYHQAKAEEIKQKRQAKKQALAQTQKAPTAYQLESEPDEDSDYESNPKHAIPDWATPSARFHPLLAQSFVPKVKVMQLFNTRHVTPDLSQLFEGIGKKYLQRTSSAIWKSPPRYSLMCSED